MGRILRLVRRVGKSSTGAGCSAHHRGAGVGARHAAAAAASGDPVRHRDPVDGADRRRVVGHRRLARAVGRVAGSGCSATCIGHAEAGDRGAPVPQRPGTGRPAEGNRPAVRRRRRRTRRTRACGIGTRVADRTKRRLRSDRLGGGPPDGRDGNRRTRHVGQRGRSRGTAQTRKGFGRSAKGAHADHGQAPQRGVCSERTRRGGGQDPQPPAGRPRRGRPHLESPGPNVTVTPTPDEIAALLQVEHLLDQRWPETKIEPSLTRITALLDLLGSPQRGYPSIHIAGTNGKTSVARMVDALLTALRRRTGRTTSPHLQSAVERISIDGRTISPARYVATYREIEPFVQLVDQQSEAAGGPAMSKFEVVTAMAFAAFADAPVDIAIVEVGLGGRWDATNVVNAPVAVITPIGVDHTDYLGDTIAQIAGEKAGIITAQGDDDLVPTDTVAVIGQQAPEAMEVLLAQAVRADAAVAREDSEFAVLGRQVAVGGQLLELQGLGGVYSDILLPLHGEHQAHNAVIALAAVEAFFGAGAQRQLDIDSVRAGFASVTSPGRLERMRSTPTVFIDAAHNPAGAAALALTLAEEFDFRFLVGVVSVLADKDAGGILAALEPVLDRIVVTHNGSPRALDVESLALAAQQWFGPDRVITAENLPAAIDTATALVAEAFAGGEAGGDALSGTGIVITGSVVTAGAARTLFGRDPA